MRLKLEQSLEGRVSPHITRARTGTFDRRTARSHSHRTGTATRAPHGARPRMCRSRGHREAAAAHRRSRARASDARAPPAVRRGGRSGERPTGSARRSPRPARRPPSRAGFTGARSRQTPWAGRARTRRSGCSDGRRSRRRSRRRDSSCRSARPQRSSRQPRLTRCFMSSTTRSR